MKLQYCNNCGWSDEDSFEIHCPECGGRLHEKGEEEEEPDG